MNNITPIALVQEHDPILRKEAELFDFDNPQIDLASFIEEMFAFMKEQGGIGLAAQQIGLGFRLFLMRIGEESFVCINPAITSWGENYEVNEEGCLSFPKLYLRVKRKTEIEVMFWDEHGERQIKELSGIAGRCFQHELDHLNGITFNQKVSKVILGMAKRRRLKINRKGERNG